MEIIEKDGFKVVGIQVVADWRGLHKEMPNTWKIFKQRVHEINHRVRDKMMDISLQYEAGLYTQIICVEVEADNEVPEGMVTCLIPNQKYIHYYHEGPLQEIAQSFSKMYRWADEHKHKTDQFKIDYGYVQNGSEERHNLYVRLK
jgi:predicted transcriptional regulator YdeE